MIITITLNPALDYYMIVDSELIDDEVNRSSREIIKAGGKGLNVSKVLETLGIDSQAIALIGGFSGEYIKNSFVNHPLIHFKGIELDGITRINSKIHSKDKTICVNGNGPFATERTKKEIREILSEINENDFVMICGSKAKGINDDFIVEMAQIVNSKKGRVVIDMESLTLDMLKQCRPYLIKPNLYEFGLLIGNKEIALENIEEGVQMILETGLENVLISLGKDGAYFANKSARYKVDQPTVNAINKVCCGDSMLAAFVGMQAKGKSVEQSLEYATAAGISQACTMDEITMEMIESYINQLAVREA